ncbi:MAG: glycoside hydrolase domain-containing protein, partial [Lentisphaeria bacterium]
MRISIFLLLISGLFLAASEPALLRVPPVSIAPVIDGQETPGEWDQAGGSFGTLRLGSAFLSQRKAHFQIAYDQDYLYFRCRSELPPQPINLLSRVRENQGKIFLDDAVELLLLPPGGQFVYQLLMNFNACSLGVKYPVSYGSVSHEIHQEWQPTVNVACGRLDKAWWLLELRLPLQDMGLDDVPWDRPWGLQMVRDWQQPAEQSPWNSSRMFCDPAQMGMLIMDPQAPALNFSGPGADYLNGTIDLRCQLFNSTGKPLTLQGSMILESDASPRHAEQDWLLAPNSKELFQLRFKDTPHTTRHLQVKIIDRNRNITLLQRQISWDPPKPPAWIDPKENRMQELDFAFYPYHKLLKATLQNATDTLFTLKNSAGIPYGASLKSSNGTAEWRELKLPPDTYTLEASAGERTQQREFQVRTFPWEHNEIGLDDSIIPPFRPLQLEQRQISALLTAYNVRNGFWDAIYADQENILAAPIQLYIDGEPLQEASFAVSRLTPHNIQCTSTLRLPGLQVESHQDYDYDGMCKVRLRFRPETQLPLQKVWLEIPLRNEFVSLMHSVGNVMKKNPAMLLPEGEGLLWHSLMASEGRVGKINYRPYIWLGGIYRGLSWFAQSDQHLSLSPDLPAMEIRREKERLILRIFLVNIPTSWKTPFELVMGFQATPVKP